MSHKSRLKTKKNIRLTSMSVDSYEDRQKQLVSQAPLIQAKLTIGQPNDKYEQEADSVADAVMHMPESKVQRQPEEEGEEDDGEVVQTKSIANKLTPIVQREVSDQEKEEEDETVQAKASPHHTPDVTPAIEANISALRGSGQPLDPDIRAFMEPRFGHDFSKVRVHADAKAAESAQAVNAHAYTIGHDVVFGTGQYPPQTSEGQRLVAHELTHVVQQGKQNEGFRFRNQQNLIQRVPTGNGEKQISGGFLLMKPDESQEGLITNVTALGQALWELYYLEYTKKYPGNPQIGAKLLLDWVANFNGLSNADVLKNDRKVRLPSMVTARTVLEKKSNSAFRQAASELIRAHTNFVGMNLNEKGLGQDLINRLPGQSAFFSQVMDTLDFTDRDDVSGYALEAATDSQIREIARDTAGYSSLLRMLAELSSGDSYPDEKKQVERVRALIPESVAKRDPVDGTQIVVKVITFDWGNASKTEGHTAVFISGNTYSFEGNGWICGIREGDYLKQNEGRTASIQVLNLPDRDARIIQSQLDSTCGTGTYGITGNTCASEAARALQLVLRDLSVSIRPQSLRRELDGRGVVKKTYRHPENTLGPSRSRRAQ